jgi:hypothetical protein
MNNFSFVLPQNFAMLQAHFYDINGVFTKDFPDNPPLAFNYTSQNLPARLLETQFKHLDLLMLRNRNLVDALPSR